MEWVPREENTLSDELTKLLNPDDSMLSHAFFRKLEERFGTHTVDLFASGLSVGYSTRCIGAGARRASMRSLLIGAESPLELAALTNC